MLAIFIPFQSSACWAFDGPWIWTKVRARSSPVVVTSTWKSPRLTRVATASPASVAPPRRA